MLAILLGSMAIKWWSYTSAINYGRSGEFFWESTGEFIGPHFNWATNEPNNVNNSEHCLIMRPEGGIYKWADRNCGHSPYICEGKIKIT
jgi:hypothetical protein